MTWLSTRIGMGFNSAAIRARIAFWAREWGGPAGNPGGFWFESTAVQFKSTGFQITRTEVVETLYRGKSLKAQDDDWRGSPKDPRQDGPGGRG